jgi:bifunctional DNA-binding transcriptional regulator/antitoxin component of YhaV-PrlF toxin-antitoxin module
MKKKKIFEKILSINANSADFSKNSPDYLQLREALNREDFFSLEVYVECDDCYGNEVNLELFVERHETDEEYKKRLEETSKRKRAAKKAADTREKNRLEREREQYERLKRKFE